MIHDEFEREFAASMDDLESIDSITIPPPATATALTTSKLAKFKRLPEIDENTVTSDISPSSSDLLYRVSSDMLAASAGGDLRKTVLINNSANEILSNSPLTLSDDDEKDDSDEHKVDVVNNNFTNGNNNNNNNNKNQTSIDNKSADDTQVKTGTKRKFIVTRMDSKVLLRPEAENLRNLTAKSNAATISFPCSSSSNRTSLSGLFAPNATFEPHLDKRFFDTSLVRINANSMQSLNNTNDNSQENTYNIDGDIWERRNDSKPRVQLVVSFCIKYKNCERESVEKFANRKILSIVGFILLAISNLMTFYLINNIQFNLCFINRKPMAVDKTDQPKMVKRPNRL